MSPKAQKKRSNSESIVDPKSEDQSPPKKQKISKVSKNGVAENGAPKSLVEGETTLTASQRKRQKNKERKLAAIARIKEEGGVPKPFYSKDKKKAAAEAAKPKPKTVEEKLKKKQEKWDEAKKLRQEKRQAEGQFKVDQVSLTADEIRLRIAEIKGRETISKTAKRKLGVLIKKLAIEEGTPIPVKEPKDKPKNGNAGLTNAEKRRLRREKKAPGQETEENEEADPNVEKVVDIQSFELKKKKNKNKNSATVVAPKTQPIPPPQKNQNEKQGNGKGKGQKKVEKVEEVEEEEDDEEEEEESEEEDEVEAEAEAEAEADEEEDSEEEEDDDEEEEEEEEEEDEEKEEEKPVAKKAKKEHTQVAKKEQNQGAKKENNQDQNSDKKRYVLFVGNVPFDAKPEDIKSHFLTKVGEVTSVRIPTNPGTQTPRGFCYVEVTNDVDYEKGLSLHHTFLNGRRINVEYTMAGSKQVSKRKELVSKNQKLHAMRKKGQLAGSQKHDQKRSVRRFKSKEQNRATK